MAQGVRGRRAGFNPRSHMGSDCCTPSLSYNIEGFNPRSHMGSDVENVAAGLCEFVSIHAPTWGATSQDYQLGIQRNVSIHAPTWGATVNGPAKVVAGMVSIHAPTWGATSCSGKQKNRNLVSIHAPTWGATGNGRLTFEVSEFQSTLPHGERQLFARSLGDVERFNPRSHMGSDHKSAICSWRKFVSIHAPTWGATAILSFAALSQ